MKTAIFQFILVIFFFSCTSKPVPPTINPQAFDKVIDGKQVKLYTLKNQKGMEITVTNWGLDYRGWSLTKMGPGRMLFLVMTASTGTSMPKKTILAPLSEDMETGLPKVNFPSGIFITNWPKNNGVNSLHGGVNGFSKKCGMLSKKMPANDPEARFPRYG